MRLLSQTSGILHVLGIWTCTTRLHSGGYTGLSSMGGIGGSLCPGLVSTLGMALNTKQNEQYRLAMRQSCPPAIDETWRLTKEIAREQDLDSGHSLASLIWPRAPPVGGTGATGLTDSLISRVCCELGPPARFL